MKMITTVIKKWIALLGILTLIFTSTSTLAQEKCLSHILDMQKMEEDPGYRNSRERLNRQVKNYLSSNPQARQESTITIPVVFQIIHNGDAVGSNENLSDALLQAQLDQLNADFARTNSDAGNTPAAFQGAAANTMIQFCLASVDPEGNATSGIVRTELALEQNACWNSTFISNNIVNNRAWNTTKYLNIFSVLKIAASDCSNNNILGYATFPGGNANLDVAVHAYYTIGSLSMANPAGGSYGMGRTVTHEVGHWLMLEHIWYSDGCGTDDGVADTPAQDKSTSGCPSTFPLTDACTGSGNGIMYMNYMDYVNDNCMNMFTADQGARMRAAITGSRPGLSNAQCGGGSCTAPAVSAPMVTQPTCTIPTGTIVVNAAGAGSLEYSVDNGSTYQASGTFSDLAAGNYTIKVRLQSDQNCMAAYDQNPVVLVAPTGCGGGNCNDYASSDLPKTIPTVGTVTSTVAVSATGSITDINIKDLMGTHGYMEDLTVTLTSPTNTTVTLWSAICSTSNVGFNINLDDDAANMIDCPLNDGATEKPANPLSAFHGENPTGTWTLTITDATDPDGGSLTAWTLELCTEGGGDCPTNRAIDDTPILAGTYQAGTQLTSMGSIAAGSTVAFRSGDNVELKPNFSVEGNAILEINIQGCP